jgi:hypothetical protein
VHPSEIAPYAIYTDARKLGISAILAKKGNENEILIVSTASRVLTPTEQRYTTCEQELLAVVYAFQKFRIYVTGHPAVVYTDNKAVSFLKKYQLTSSRVTRWVMQLQEFDLSIEHVKGTNNHFADLLSRNPVGVNSEIRKQARGKYEILVARINLDVDKLLVKELRNITFHQNSDPNLVKIRQLEKDPLKYSEKYCVNNHILSREGVKNYPYWRTMIPKFGIHFN